MIQVTALNKYFHNGVSSLHILKDINLTFPETGLVTIFGHSGSGKTTLLNIIGLMDSFDSGEINWYGKTFDKYHYKQFDEIRNKDIGYIFQNYHLIEEESVYDNVAYPLHLLGIKDKKVIDNQVMYALEAVGMAPFYKRNVKMLSGGQQQRIAIARAIAKDAKVIIADEPTGNLDSDNTFEVMNIIKKISKERLVILVSHEENLVDFYSDRIIQIQDGSIISDKEHQGTTLLHKDTRNIYLGDMNVTSSLENEQIHVDFYSSKKEDNLDLDVVLKGDTYYIKPKQNKKIIVVDEHSEVKFVKESQEEFQEKLSTKEHKFDLSKVHIEEEYCSKRNPFALLGSAIKNSFFKSKRFFKRSRMTSFVFVLSSILFAFLFPILNRYINVTKYEYLDVSSQTLKVIVDGDTSPLTVYDKLDKLFYKDDNVLSMHSPTSVACKFSGSSFYNFESTINEWCYPMDESVYSYDVCAGRKISAENEVVISKLIYESVLESKQSKFLGLKSSEDFLESIISIYDQYFKIVGLSDEESTAIMLPHSYYQKNIENESDSYFRVICIDTNDKEKAKQKLKGSYRVVDPAVNGKAYAIECHFKDNPYVAIILGIMTLVIALYIILMVRATMFKKIKEIGVLRTIGAKKSDIRNIFLGEMVAITTTSSITCYVATLLVQLYYQFRYGIGILGYSISSINAFVFIGGIAFIYLIAIISAMIPVCLLLRKTPIEIIKKYDI